MASKNKKGISAIVATVMIVLITVAAVSIIWLAIIPMMGKMDLIPGFPAIDSGFNMTGINK